MLDLIWPGLYLEAYYIPAHMLKSGCEPCCNYFKGKMASQTTVWSPHLYVCFLTKLTPTSETIEVEVHRGWLMKFFAELVFDWQCMWVTSRHTCDCEVSRQNVVQQKFSKARWLPRLGVHIFVCSKFTPAAGTIDFDIKVYSCICRESKWP